MFTFLQRSNHVVDRWKVTIVHELRLREFTRVFFHTRFVDRALLTRDISKEESTNATNRYKEIVQIPFKYRKSSIRNELKYSTFLRVTRISMFAHSTSRDVYNSKESSLDIFHCQVTYSITRSPSNCYNCNHSPILSVI